MKHLNWLLLLATALCACSGQRKEEDASKQVILQDRMIHVGAESPVLAKLETAPVRKELYRMEFTTSGVVRAIPSRYAEVASPVEGRVMRAFVRLGQKVAPGSPLFEISAPAVFEAGKAYSQAKEELALAEKNLSRERDLMQNRVGVQKALEEAEANYAVQQQEFMQAKAALKVFQIDPEQYVPGQPLIVRAPIAGEVVKSNLVMGQYLKEDADPVMIVADLEKVWVVAHVKEKDLPLVQALEEVEIQLVALPDRKLTGQIYHISELLDPDTRSVEILIECDNRERLMKPEMYGMVKLSDKEASLIRIPTTAILQEEDAMYVLVEEAERVFRKQPIEAGQSEDGKTVVLNGLQEGERIVVKGAFYLLDAR